MKLLAFAASLRRQSWNRKLIGFAVTLVRQAGAEVDLAEFQEFEMPLYNRDLQDASGFPPGAEELRRRVAEADGMLIASPEYNYSLPGTLKNAIDWVSRMSPMPFRGKSAFLLSASTSQVGGIRGLWQLRIPLEGVGVLVHPDMYALPWADKAFDEAGGLKEKERRDRLAQMLEAYLTTARKLAGEPGRS
jgi:chromate reductase, NAD(P)H dehydrogenase (quinone)